MYEKHSTFQRDHLKGPFKAGGTKFCHDVIPKRECFFSKIGFQKISCFTQKKKIPIFQIFGTDRYLGQSTYLDFFLVELEGCGFHGGVWRFPLPRCY